MSEHLPTGFELRCAEARVLSLRRTEACGLQLRSVEPPRLELRRYPA